MFGERTHRYDGYIWFYVLRFLCISGREASAIFEIDAFIALVQKTVTFNCIDAAFKQACALHVNAILFGEAEVAVMINQ